MQHLYRIIKKKKYKRLLGVLWVFLIAIELFCPVFCDEPSFAAEQNSQAAIVQKLSASEDVAISESSDSISDEGAAQDQPVCNDECLCHATAVPGISVGSLKEVHFRGERIAFLTSETITTSLSPPHQPPKIA